MICFNIVNEVAAMKILCLNAWGGVLHDELIPYVDQENPDILCLQEVIHSPGVDEDWLSYRDGSHMLPQRANLLRDLSLALPDHRAVFCPASQGLLWKESASVSSQWGIATFVRNSFPIIAQFQGFVHKGYSPHGYGEHPRSRSAHAMRVFDYQRDRPICIAHMHGLRDIRGKHDSPERSEQARRFVSIISSILEENDPLVVCGDFNVEPQSETLDILSEIGLSDLVTARTTKGTRTSYYKKAGRNADYMLINPQVDVLNFNVVFEPEVSDHCPLVLEI